MTTAAIPVPRSKAEEIDDPRQHLLLDPRPREELNRMVMEAMRSTPPSFWVTVGVLALLVLVCLAGAWLYMTIVGMGVAGIRRPTYWGMFIANFVFWIGISHSGTFVSAILRVFRAEFRRPITRAAELMTAIGLIVAGMYPLIHLGRVWVSYWIIPYPNQRMLWPNVRSPLVWDMIAIATYLISSSLYLILPLIPDLAMARDHSTGWRRRLYHFLSLGWRGTESEWARLRSAVRIFAFAIIPVMFSVHTIVSWDFAVTKTPGWHSTIFGPFFIAGAIYSGVAAVAMILFLVRTSMPNMKYFIREEHFDSLGKLMLIFSFTWTYFYFNEYILAWYGGDLSDQYIWNALTKGPYAWLWYSMLILNIAIPWLTLWSGRIRRTPWLMFGLGVVINLGMYIERYLIVPGMISRNRFPFTWDVYQPRIELVISVGSLSLFLLLYLLATRLIPLIPVWEVAEGQFAYTLRRIGKKVVPAVSETE
ncbi:MAG: polysulfide reductase NrfD [Actinobacteria bacterium]|nr:polysulfide reductase NrfD [Actinomycetota bacterium]